MKKQRVYWAFDPYSNIKSSWKSAADTLKAMSDVTNLDVTPIYFLDDSMINWLGQATPERIETLLPIIRGAIKSDLKEYEGFEFSEPEVVYVGQASRRDVVEHVCEYMETHAADLVLINTHARDGWKRALLGSFAESLLMELKTPLLLVSPNTKKVESFRNVFFPTDLSDESFEAFKCFLSSSLSLGMHINLYSKVNSASEVYTQAAVQAFGGGWVSMSQFTNERREDLEERAKKWKEEAIKSGKSLDVFVDDVEGHLDDRIFSMVNETKSDFIAIPTFATKAENVLVGSRAREIIRNSDVPVMVQHFRKK